MADDTANPFEEFDPARREFAEHLWQHIPADGRPIGNTLLRRKSKTMSSRLYWDTRNAMVSAGLLQLGGGRGGSVKRTDQYSVAPAGLLEVMTHGLELALYHGITERLHALLADQGRFEDHTIEATGLQGRRATGGKWSRPDITVVGLRRFEVLAGAYLEVHTYEIKTAAGFDIAALHEARAHRRRAHRSYVLVDLESPDDEARVEDLVDDARDLGVGLVSFLATGDTWSWWHEPKLFLPDPIELDSFLSTQLSPTTKQKIRAWRAQPAVAGTE